MVGKLLPLYLMLSVSILQSMPPVGEWRWVEKNWLDKRKLLEIHLYKYLFKQKVNFLDIYAPIVSKTLII